MFPHISSENTFQGVPQVAVVQYTFTHKQYTSTEQHKTQYIEQYKYFGRVRAVPFLCGLYPGICLTTEEKARKILSQGSRRASVGTIKIHTRAIRLHRHNNNNTYQVL